MIHVLANITAKPGMRDRILDAFRANVPHVLKEEGCIEYGATIDAPNVPAFNTPFGPDTLIIIEKWESIAALEAHFTQPHQKEYGAKTKDLIASRLVHVLEPVAP